MCVRVRRKYENQAKNDRGAVFGIPSVSIGEDKKWQNLGNI